VVRETRVVARGVWQAVLIVAVAVLLVNAGLALGASSPGGRAYELVSPPQKNGIDIAGMPSYTRVAVNGNAVSYIALGGFGDAIGSGLATNYMSVRDGRAGTSGWSTHAITPSQQPNSFVTELSGLAPFYVGDFSPDLNSGVFRAISPLTDAPNVAQTHNLYVRHDLLSAGPGSYQLASGSVSPLGPLPFAHATYRPSLVGGSADFSHVVFESALRLTADAPACTAPGDAVYGCGPLLYDSVNGTVRLVGILPDGTPAPVSVAGQSASLTAYTPHAVSQDGSRIVFTDAFSPTTPAQGDLFMRIDGSSTVQLNASERSSPDPAGPQPAKYWDATPDDAAVYFTSGEQLTDDDTNHTVDLYRYELAAPAGHRLTRLSVDSDLSDGDGASVSQVIGASTDGHYVYFIAEGQLVPGAPAGVATRIYVWHDGSVHQVGILSSGFGNDSDLDGQPGYSLQLKLSRVSPDGRFMVFVSHSGVGLTGYDHGTCAVPSGGGTNSGSGPCAEFYEYDAAGDGGAGVLSCVSCVRDGTAASFGATTNDRVNASATPDTFHLNRFLADDGRVFFDTGERLVGGDVNGSVVDVYEYDPVSRSVQLVSSGHSPDGSYFVDASPDGRDVFFLTRERLVGWDVDQNDDLYDARLGGGFPEPAGVPGPCVGNACQGPASSAPADRVPGSVAFHAGQDPLTVGVFRVVSLTASQVRVWAAGGVLALGVRISRSGRLSARVLARIGHRRRVVASAARGVRSGGVAHLRLSLSRIALRALAHSGRLRVGLSVSYSEADGGPEQISLLLKHGGR
jgi:hypothetical protein